MFYSKRITRKINDKINTNKVKITFLFISVFLQFYVDFLRYANGRKKHHFNMNLLFKTGKRFLRNPLFIKYPDLEVFDVSACVCVCTYIVHVHVYMYIV